MSLTEKGQNYFVTSPAGIRRVELYDGREQFGFSISQANPKSIQQLVLRQYISYLEMRVKALSDQRDEVIDVTKAVTYAQLYRQFGQSVRAEVVLGPAGREWNKSHRQDPLHYDCTPKALLRAGAAGQLSATRSSVEQELRAYGRRAVLTSKGMDPDERERRFDSINRLVGFIPPEIITLTALYRSTSGKRELADQLFESVAQQLDRTLRRFQIADYLGLLVVELVILVSEGLVERPAFTTWGFNSVRRDSRERQRLHVTVSAEKLGFADLKKQITERGEQAASAKSVLEFYDQLEREGNTNELAVYYLNSLSEVCGRHDMTFESFVNTSSRSNQSLVNVLLTV